MENEVWRVESKGEAVSQSGGRLAVEAQTRAVPVEEERSRRVAETLWREKHLLVIWT